MGLAIRRLLAVISASGLTASVLIYIGGFQGTTMDSIAREAVVLHVGVFLVLLPIYLIEYASGKGQMLFWKAFSRGMPRWAIRGIRLFGVLFIFHFIFFLVQSHAASPKIKDGAYVLDSHGQTVKVLSASEYRSLKGAELRLFASGWMFFYFTPVMYWWFSRTREPRSS